MCQQCKNGTFWGDEIEAADDLEFCEVGGPDSRTCDGPAIYAINERRVEDHLCQQCLDVKDQAPDTGLGDFYREAGLQQAGDFLPIPGSDAHAKCSNVVGDPLKGETMTVCGRPANYAAMVWGKWACCKKHAAEMGYSP